ncbi:TPA: cold shock domain-containing protein [Raoultella ornithinolytica]|jgi:cold shock CspA family protein|uniref:cold shock domain-containing protein n=1 Tax=Raoultella ornithinolytica TaxID=54291 RepID=UPI00024FCB41|nr:cold shock domain-containing protein [Raoultella ornithinolytica]EHT14894.1 hypothetical protein HMPREF9690_00205 [Raoultella ornithinolytica 10-5246]EKU2862521.1 cold shock domain-containing protein [Raoultella ornithinolytica]ELS0895465.1 cold shock domain-containing protein [Raoultella ornithinolytica]MDI0343537.1 cold shock domain-containing protein [Raoultella ornithinolytica]MDI0398783.1 cold shock domain-containing protein [Raoultella ornithinolytica]
MDGVVKWFSEEQGYGFITDKDNNDYYFHISNVKGTVIPKNSQNVFFDIEDNKAKNVSLTRKKESTFKILSPDYRKSIFDLYKDIFACVTIAILGVFLIKNNFQSIGWLIYFSSGLLSMLAIIPTIKMAEEKYKSKNINKLNFLILSIFIILSIIILIGGLLKGAQEYI